jgi:ligand-binding sensor domain-containing protein
VVDEGKKEYYQRQEKMMKHLLVCALLMLVSCAFCKGQNKTETPKNDTRYKIDDVVNAFGPNVITRNIMRDRTGNIWMATWDGVIRYDGMAFTNITSKVSSARFFSVIEDRKGTLWFGSIGSGAYSYDGKSFQNLTTKEGLVDNEISAIYEDKAGNIWFGGNGGVSRYDGKSIRNYMMNGDSVIEVRIGKTFSDFTPSTNEVNSIMEGRTGKFWFATRGNTFVYDGKGFTVFSHHGKPFNNVRTIIEDKKGDIWLGGNDGLWRYDGSAFTKVVHSFVGYIYEDRKGNIWTSSANQASDRNWVLSRYEAKSLSDLVPTVFELKPAAGMLFGISEDDKGNIWFGAMGGVYRYDGNIITDFRNKWGQK